MNERLDSYLTDLDGRLRSQIEDVRREEVIAELRFHLTMSARDAQSELEMEADEAARAALRGLGPVETVAEDLVRQHRGGTARSQAQVVKTQVVLYVTACILVPIVVSLLPDRFSILPETQFALTYSPTLFLVAFAIAVWRSRHWLVKPMSVAIAASTAFMILIALSPIVPILKAIPEGGYAQAQARRTRELDEEIRVVQLGTEAYLRKDPRFQREGGFLVPQNTTFAYGMAAPFLPFYFTMGSQTSLDLVAREWSPELAKQWRELGDSCLANLKAERVTAQAGWVGPGTSYPWLLFLGVAPLLQIGMLGLVNLAVLGASNRRRQRRSRRDPHLA